MLSKHAQRKAVKTLNMLKDLAESGDQEQAHIRADEVLCLVLKAYELDKIAEAFEAVPKWYT